MAMFITVVTLVSTAVQCPDPDPPTPPTPDPPKPDPPLLIDSSYDITCDGAELTLTLNASDSWSATMEGGTAWCLLDKTSGTSGKETIVVTVTPNLTYTKRDCIINLKIGEGKGRVAIHQAQRNVLQADPYEFKIEAGGGYVTTRVTANVEYEVSLSTDWIEWDDGIISIAENLSAESRTATLTFEGGGLTFTITLVQDPSDNPISPYDGTVETLQEHTVGAGIPLVLMGDAFDEGKIEDGTYRALMESAAEAFFGEEPYTTFRDMFDVYMVNVVSDYYVDITTGNSTSLGTYIDADSFVGGNMDKCQAYIKRAVNDELMDKTVAIVLLNTDQHAGRCYLSFIDNGEDAVDDGACGLAIAFSALGTDAEDFTGLIHHEAGGHGFGKLADEYYYDGTGAIPATSVEFYQKLQTRSKAYMNVVFSDDPEASLWASFLSDERYQAENLGMYPGGCTYEEGVWHPTEFSIMNLNFGGFNAPSRETIYCRLHKLAYGPEWEYDFDEFVAYDAINRASEPEPEPEPEPVPARRSRTNRFVPCPPPVIIIK